MIELCDFLAYNSEFKELNDLSLSKFLHFLSTYLRKLCYLFKLFSAHIYEKHSNKIVAEILSHSRNIL